MSLAVAKATTPPRYTASTPLARPRGSPSPGGQARIGGRPSGLKGASHRASRDGLRPPLTPEPLRPPRQALRGRPRPAPPMVPARQGLPSAPPLTSATAGDPLTTP